MTAPLRHQQTYADPLAIFELRCWARATLYAACEFSLIEAVDKLQVDAERDGLIDKIGQDRVQDIMREAFHKFRGDGP